MDDCQAPEHLLTFFKELKMVFDVCDEDADGFIRTEDFVQLGSAFGTGEEVKILAKCMEPNNNGSISFREFVSGVLTIKGNFWGPGLEPELEFISQSCGTDGNENQQDCLVVMCTRAYPDLIPECQLFPEEVEGPEVDVADEGRERESDRDSAVGSTQGSDSSDTLIRPADKEDTLGDLFFSGEKCGQTNVSVISDLSTRSSASLNEEQFEDYGEGEEPDYTLSSPCLDDETQTHVYSDLGSSVPSSAGQTPRRVRQHCSGEAMDVFCSQCSKKVNLLQDLEARLKTVKANSPSRKISSTAFGRQLLNNSNLSSSNGSTEDLFRDSIESCDININEKVSFLEKKVAELESEIVKNVEVKSRLKQDNMQLVHRVHELEEQLKDQETRAEQNLHEELRRHRDAYSKMERDMNTQTELLNTRVKQLEEENSEMSLDMCRLKSQTDKLDKEKQRMTDKLEDTSLRLRDEMDLYRKMMEKLKENRLQFQKEKEAMQEVIEDLRRELEHLQMLKLEGERPGRSRTSSTSMADFNSRSREMELEHEVKRLKQRFMSQDFQASEFQQPVLFGAWLHSDQMENQRLREQNDELNGQILSLSLYEAKNLFATQTKAQSLAAEIENASRDQIMEALKEQEDINLRLRQYMDKIILSILDNNPSLLEIKY
ncbi:rab11 family-interacting protein 4B isoform X2 [Cynoglossus semilaevis]|uniref:rab11 family-interacting protein 4B isoform X2 n=1 Tax=Cynoglossus semilaevis TaxID=244447 RepID=UPI000D62B037|nr:rab11 family-interacting protein 4 isoform X2 [Cynoglossus semilaevis]